ncbi:phytanoyl-CoA dioxygenase [Paenibacillus rhizovicinus]|uniref:Phytanoyl-CoA dioxygenase n=1 Tax=Paenibacillus rhizovicinus TaxID=2704463 RepID=A0A6C0NYH9_9BACL|nr:HEAT repeat domain-containing protein [Paenibacillus rhizovicinus]QHW31249.1 phytanoyl-CoA dioxygenase [Paenibacillus rhizovicinus]
MNEQLNLLSDKQMADFITNGYVVLQNELPEALHRSVMRQIDFVMQEEGNPGNNILPRVPDIGKFFETPVVKGALTSVLGPDYYMHPHRHMHYNQPGNQMPGGGQWHKDGYWSSMRSHRPWWVMMFYYTQDITEEMGPTAIMPGSQYSEKLPGRETILPTGKAGTIALVHFDLWHKASLNTSNLDRYMLKFQFVRLREPVSPSWNHSDPVPDFPADRPDGHLVLWQDTWNWYLGNRSGAGSELAEQPELVAELREREMAALDAQLSDGDAAVRAIAADRLGLIGEAAAGSAAKLSALVQDAPAEDAGLNAAYALGRMGTTGMQALLELLKHGSKLASQRAAYGLQAAGAAAVPDLALALGQAEENSRALAAFALGMNGAGASSAVPALIAALEDQSEWVRRNAVEALGMIGEPAELTVPALVRMLKEAVRREAAEDTGSAGGSDLYVANQAYITNKIAYTAALSLLRIGKLGDPELVLSGLQAGLGSKDRYARAYAFEALTALRTERAIDVLIHYYRTARWCSDTHKASTF